MILIFWNHCLLAINAPVGFNASGTPPVGGDVVAPAPAAGRVQFIDVRDLGEWMVSLSERQEAGTFNAVNEGVAWSELLETCRDVSGSDARFVWIDADFLSDHGVEEWMDLPLWISDDEAQGMHRVDVSRALEAGLTFRPLPETIKATLDRAETTDDAGLPPNRERQLLAAWEAR